jgi:hypothetical protein
MLIVVRNPIDVVNSSLIRREAARHGLDSWPINSVYEAVREWILAWRRTYSLTREWPDLVKVLKYEELCANLESEAARVFDFLGLQPHVPEIGVERLPSDVCVLTDEERSAIMTFLAPIVERWSDASALQLLAAYGDMNLPYVIGEKVELSWREATPYLPSGFSWREEWGRWTLGSRATLAIPHGETQGAILVELWLACAYTGAEEACDLVVSMGPQNKNAFSVGPERSRLTIVADATDAEKPGLSTLEICVARPRRADEAASDRREIGVGLAAFRVTRLILTQ